MGLFRRLGRVESSGATPGESPPPNAAVVARANGRGTLAGGVLAADAGLLHYGLGGPMTVRPMSQYPGPGDAVGGSTIGAGNIAGGVIVARHTDTSASPLNPPFPATFPAGLASGRGQLAGAALAGEAGNLERGPGELVNLRYLPFDPRVTDPTTLLPPVRELQGYRPGRAIVSYYVDPLRMFGVSPMLNGTHGAVRRTPYVAPPPNGQLAHGSSFPTVYRPAPMPWDAGIVRGGPR